MNLKLNKNLNAMDEFLNYFEAYYKKYYGANDFYSDDKTFQCHFPDERDGSKPFVINLLSEKAYHLMVQHDILDRYLEILKVRDSHSSHDEGIRACYWDYTFKVEKCMLEYMDEILPYLQKKFADTLIPLSNCLLLFTIVGRGDNQVISIMNGETYEANAIGEFKRFRSVGELEEADLKLGDR